MGKETPEKIVEVIEILEDAQKGWAGILIPYSPEWTHPLKEAIEILETIDLLPEGKPPLLSDEEIGDCLDLENDYEYPCSDGSRLHTIDCHKVAQAQRKIDIKFYGGRRCLITE